MSLHDSDASFKLFPQLPVELRLKIWHDTVSAYPSRLVEICTDCHFSNVDYTQNSVENRISDIAWLSRTPNPAVFSVCRESRREASKYWRLRFDLDFATAGSDGQCVYINPTHDVIYPNLKWVELFHTFVDDIKAFLDVEGAGFRNLALDNAFISKHYSSLSGLDASYKAGQLRRLFAVAENTTQAYDEEWDGLAHLVEFEGKDAVEWSGREEIVETLLMETGNAEVELVRIKRTG
ncbi:MAG: hypothetical protein Q9160_005628 [Pyrenula sp. 1 TL-2023]